MRKNEGTERERNEERKVTDRSLILQLFVNNSC